MCKSRDGIEVVDFTILLFPAVTTTAILDHSFHLPLSVTSIEKMKKPQPCNSVTGLPVDHQASLQSMIEQCRCKGILEQPASLSPDDALDGLSDETTLLRFLRGRSFDVAGAVKQFEEAQAIRKSADALAEYNLVDVTDFEQARSMYPHWTGRRTRTGLPVCIFDVSHLDDLAISNYGKERTTSKATGRAIVALDYLTRFVLPLCSAAGDRLEPDRSVTSAVYLVDIASFSFKQAWSVRGYAQDISKLLATCYPEVVDKVYVLNAASCFAKIWGLLKKWIDPRTAEKLVIVPSADTLETLSETIDIENIPMQYGGKFESKQGMTPRLDNTLRTLLAVEELPMGPIKWQSDVQGNRTALAVGSQKGTAREEIVGQIIPRQA